MAMDDHATPFVIKMEKPRFHVPSFNQISHVVKTLFNSHTIMVSRDTKGATANPVLKSE